MKHSSTFFFLSFFIFLAGCGVAHVKNDIGGNDLTRYQNIIVKEVKVYSNESAAQQNAPLQKKLKDWESHARTQLENHATDNNRNLVDSLEGAVGDTMALDLDVNVAYGNRALRWAVGFGAGKGGVHSTLTARDARTGEIRYQGEADSDLSMGGFGGDIGTVLEKNIAKLIENFNAQGNL